MLPNFSCNLFIRARNEKIENDLSLGEQQVDNFCELYLTEHEQKLELERELRDCKVNLEKTSNNLLDLQENYKLLVSTLKENEHTISKLLKSVGVLLISHLQVVNTEQDHQNSNHFHNL
ncbi:Kinesin-like protein KIN-5B [Glycine soja]